MKRNLRVAMFATSLVGAVLSVAISTPSHATQSPAGEYAARTATHLPSTIQYDDNYDRMSPTVVCYEGYAHHRTQIRGHAVQRHHWVQYCTDGWVSIQRGHDHWVDIKPHLCAYEDSPNCYWDAGSEGNGIGHSFYATDHCVLYVQRAFAARNDYCE